MQLRNKIRIRNCRMNISPWTNTVLEWIFNVYKKTFGFLQFATEGYSNKFTPFLTGNIWDSLNLHRKAHKLSTKSRNFGIKSHTSKSRTTAFIPQPCLPIALLEHISARIIHHLIMQTVRCGVAPTEKSSNHFSIVKSIWKPTPP